MALIIKYYLYVKVCAVVVLSCLCCTIMSPCRTDVAVSVPQVRLFARVASDKISIRSGRDDVGCLVSADCLYFKAGQRSVILLLSVLSAHVS